VGQASENDAKQQEREDNLDSYMNAYGRAVFGSAGCRKTTLFREVVNSIKSEKLLQECKYMFFLDPSKIDFDQ